MCEKNNCDRVAGPPSREAEAAQSAADAAASGGKRKATGVTAIMKDLGELSRPPSSTRRSTTCRTSSQACGVNRDMIWGRVGGSASTLGGVEISIYRTTRIGYLFTLSLSSRSRSRSWGCSRLVVASTVYPHRPRRPCCCWRPRSKS